MKQFNLIGKLASGSVLPDVQLFDNILQAYTKSGVVVFTKIAYGGEPVSLSPEGCQLIDHSVIFNNGTASGDGYQFSVTMGEKAVNFDHVEPMDTFRELPLSFMKDAKNYYSKDPLRVALCGVGVKDGNLWATDAFVMSWTPYVADREVLIPGFLIDTVFKVLPFWIGYNLNNTHIQIKAITKDGVEIYFQCPNPECKLPDYSAVLPTPDKLAEVKIDAVINSVEKVGRAANKYTCQVDFEITPTSINLAASDIDLCTEAKDSIPAEATEPIEISLNYKRFVTIAKSIKKGFMSLGLTSENRAVIIEGNTPVKYLLMPIIR